MLIEPFESLQTMMVDGIAVSPRLKFVRLPGDYDFTVVAASSRKHLNSYIAVQPTL